MFDPKAIRIIVSLAFSKLGDLLVSAKTTLPAALIAVGAPVWIISVLVPIRESGALLPQAMLGKLLKHVPARHWAWRIGSLIHALAIGAMVLALWLLSGQAAGVAVMVLLAVLSLGRAACSLTMKDIQANVVAKGQRGRLGGLASTASGVVTLVVAIAMLVTGADAYTSLASWLIALASLAFLLSLVALWPVTTTLNSAKDESTTTQGFDSVLWRFILVRGLFAHSALLAPFFMLQRAQDAMSLLPYYLAAQAIATMISAFVWGRLADVSARRTLQFAGSLAVVACVMLLSFNVQSDWQSGLIFFVLALAHTGVRMGRKTYSLDVKDGQQRTEFVANSNTAIGIILIALGALYSALQAWTDWNLVMIMAGMLIVGILLTQWLPNEKG